VGQGEIIRGEKRHRIRSPVHCISEHQSLVFPTGTRAAKTPAQADDHAARAREVREFPTRAFEHPPGDRRAVQVAGNYIYTPMYAPNCRDSL